MFCETMSTNTKLGRRKVMYITISLYIDIANNNNNY